MTHLKKSKISKSELLKIGDKICLCKIKKQVDSEKNKIIELFFELNKHTNNSKKLRQKSLSLLLDVVKQIQKYKIIEPEDFLNACYFQEIEENKIKINNKFTDVVKKWKIIKAHDNFSLSSELALQAFLKFLEEEKNQSSEESFYKKCVSKMDDEINHILQTNEKFSEKPIQDIIHHILKQNNISTDSELYKQSMEFDELVKISSKINEQIFVKTLERLVKSKEIDVTKVITNSTLLVILTGLRFSSIVDSDDESIRWLKQKTRQDVGVIEFTKFVSEQIHQNVILKEFVKNFIKKFVIFQAEQTFRGKYNGKTNPKRWFRKEGTQYIKERSYESKHKNVRFEIAISLLDDLDLIDKTDKSIICTNDGEKILKKVTG